MLARGKKPLGTFGVSIRSFAVCATAADAVANEPTTNSAHSAMSVLA
jgi:hypothetical protein